MSQDKNNQTYNGYHISEIIEMAWCDKTSFDDIFVITGLHESDVITLMRRHLKISSFKMWRKRVSGRKAKHDQRINTSSYDGDDE